MTERTSNVAGVRFRNAGRIFYFHAAGMRLDVGEYVVVASVRGPEIARVVISPDQVVVDELGHEDLKPILRLATDEDIRTMDGLRLKAAELLPEARRLASDAGFPGRIDSADFTLDGRRLTFSFASEERLDYREFLRRAGDRFGARIEMRQVGARDRARQAGGYGICGRELCCSGWLSSFPAISIRMAKEQDLPLNPQKISGLCGRLLCCLSYEEEGYAEMRRSLPKLGQRCSTPTGEGKVIALNILRRQVTLVVDGQRIEVEDRDLGTVVRWDPASKSGTPPPSMTHAEAVAAGLREPGEEPAEAPEDDWVTGRAPTRGDPRPRPGGGLGRPRPEPGRGERPGEQRPERGPRPPARADRGQPPRAGGPEGSAQRVFRRATPAEPTPQAESTAGGQARGARRRRGRGPRPPAANDPPAPRE